MKKKMLKGLVIVSGLSLFSIITSIYPTDSQDLNFIQIANADPGDEPVLYETKSSYEDSYDAWIPTNEPHVCNVFTFVVTGWTCIGIGNVPCEETESRTSQYSGITYC